MEQQAPEATLVAELERLQQLLSAVGVNCRGLAWSSGSGRPGCEFREPTPEVQQAWAAARERVRGENKFVLQAAGPAALMCFPLPTGGAVPDVIAAWVLPPFSEKTAALVQLSLGWLKALAAEDAAGRGAIAAWLLETQAHVLSQRKLKAAAQEWMNRLALLPRPPTIDTPLVFSWFAVDEGAPRWIASSGTAWVEKGSEAQLAAAEMALRAVVESRPVETPAGWALPVMADGKVICVLLAQGPAQRPDSKRLAETSAQLLGATLEQWLRADRGLGSHLWSELRRLWQRLRDPGHLTWKVGAAAVALLLVLLVAVPVPDRVSADVLVEAQQLQVVTAPFEGFLSVVEVRPGDRVQAGQLLARFDDRELQLDYEKSRSGVDQAMGKLRQATAGRDFAASRIAAAELAQAQAEFDLLESRIRRSRLLAPLTGTVVSGDWHDQIGSPVEVGKKLFEVAPDQGYRVVLHVLDRDITGIRVGQAGAIRLEGMPQSRFDFEVSRVTSVASVEDSKNGFRVEARLLAPPVTIRPGMQGVGKVVVGSASLLRIWLRPALNWLRLKLWALSW